ncbi:MAG: inositol monophosphatase family protein [Sphaerochaeta sp.]|jgi:fructose-1,6-bisphosphatase/inositol monophosphatase family enzyme
MNHTLSPESLDNLAHLVRSCGRWAHAQQKEITRTYKSDGTVVTEVDLEISRRIIEHLQANFPQANIISEENPLPFDEEAAWTFILDPIDGTDVYSQGMPCWAVALAILDNERNPVGALISAPRWGIGEEELFIRLDPGGVLLVNDQPFTLAEDKDFPHQITMGSFGQRYFDFSRFEGKIRIFGSAILHLLSAVIYPHVQGALAQSCYAWDIAAAHAVLKHVGMDVEYIDGNPFHYSDRLLIERKKFHPPLYAGTKACIKELGRLLPPDERHR